jgi:hypothetical protein
VENPVGNLQQQQQRKRSKINMGNTVPQSPNATPEQTPSSGVRVTGPAVKTQEELLQDAYNTGRQDTLKTFDQIAAEAYEQTSKYILEIQKESIARSEKMVSFFFVFDFFIFLMKSNYCFFRGRNCKRNYDRHQRKKLSTVNRIEPP